MHLTITNVWSDSGSESDYETAVDLEHYSWSNDVVELMTPGLVLIVIRSQWSAKTRSHLEPDFRLLEETGDCVYVQHSSAEPAEYSESVWLEVHTLAGGQTLSMRDWRIALGDTLLDAEVPSKEDFDRITDTASEWSPSEFDTPVSAKDLLTAVSKLTKLRKNGVVDTAALDSILGIDFTKWCQDLDSLGWLIQSLRFSSRLRNRCNLANARLQFWLTRQR